MKAFHKITISSKNIDNSLSHASHDVHIYHNVFRICYFYADVRNRRTNWTHAIWNDIHGSAFHATIQKFVECLFHLTWINPIVGRPSVLFSATANKGAVFHPGYITRIGKAGETVRSFFFIESNECSFLYQEITHFIILRFGPVTPAKLIRLTQIGSLFDPRL